MKNIKCSKCGIYFKDRKDEKDTEFYKGLCSCCRLAVVTLELSILTINNFEEVNRIVEIDMENIKIRKK